MPKKTEKILSIVLITSFLIGQKSAKFVTEESISLPPSTEAALYSHNETESTIIYEILSSSTTLSSLSLSPTEEDEEERRHKFISSQDDIILEHTDFVTLRLKHLLNQTTSNLTELRILQQQEFDKHNDSTSYKDGWEHATQAYNETKKALIFQTFANSSIILNAPEEYHIALIAYTGPYIYYDFNSKTRALCSGFDIDNYEYKSFFKLLELAIESLGPEIQRLMSSNSSSQFANSSGESVLYRGVSHTFALKIGQRLAFQHFISTSRNPDVAQGFSWGSGATVFEIHAERNHSLQYGVYLGVHSIFSGEEEVLLSPLQIFQVDSVSKDGEKGIVQAVVKAMPIIPPCQEECNSNNVNLDKLKGFKEYGEKLKLAVAILGAVVCTFILVGGALSLYMVIKGRKFCYKMRTDSELQLT